MPTLRFPLLLTAFAGLLTFSACQKEITPSENAGTEVATVSTEECPSLTAHLAEADAAQQLKHTQLLQYFTADQIADLQTNVCLAKEAPAVEAGLEERASGLKNRF